MVMTSKRMATYVEYLAPQGARGHALMIHLLWYLPLSLSGLASLLPGQAVSEHERWQSMQKTTLPWHV